MAIAMVIRYVDVICDDSLKSFYINGNRMGYQFDVRLACYRGHFLSMMRSEMSLRCLRERTECGVTKTARDIPGTPRPTSRSTKETSI